MIQDVTNAANDFGAIVAEPLHDRRMASPSGRCGKSDSEDRHTNRTLGSYGSRGKAGAEARLVGVRPLPSPARPVSRL